ncbi:MAG TPA: cupin domain-containing protein [Vicinamibacterales bacterium]|nr:cupin domain-containing protein [Vicinamibacterales bacterium]
MNDRAEQLIRELGLQPHPEGGHYVEVHRSPAVTTIYFLIRADEKSCWHRVRSEEIWHFYEGAPLDLLQLSPDAADLERIVLGPLSDRQRPVHCVPANCWQAARSRGAFTLVGCTVAPAFQFADFALLRDSPALAATIGRRHPAVAQFV